MKFIKAIRGAITVEKDSKEEISTASIELINAVYQNNSLNVNEDIISIYFTLTPDLRSFNPATAIREKLQWNNISMICAQEAFIEGGLPKCIRLMLHAYLPQTATVQHIYLRESQSLRTDWCKNI